MHGARATVEFTMPQIATNGKGKKDRYSTLQEKKDVLFLDKMFTNHSLLYENNGKWST